MTAHALSSSQLELQNCARPPTAPTGNFKKCSLRVGLFWFSMSKHVFQYAIVLLCLGSLVACKQNSGAGGSESAKLETEDQKTLYALGLLLGRNVKPFALKPEELAIVKAGLTDAVTDPKPQVEIDTYGPKVNEVAEKRASAGAEDAKKKGQEFVDKVAKEKDATKTES